MASEAVLKYLFDTNRPYSCADVTVNLRGAFPKTAIQKALDALSESGKIKCKLYGKQKVFAAIQLDIAPGDDDNEDYDGKIKSLTESASDRVSALRTAENNLKLLLATPKTSVAKSVIEETKSNISTLQNKLESLKNTTQIISTEDKKKILSEHSKLLSEYRKRKRICSDIIEALMEGYNKPKKTLIEELCIETDEIADFKLMSSQ